MNQHLKDPGASKLPYVHRVAGASKQIGVQFFSKLPKGYITPQARIPDSVSAEDYLQVVSKVSQSNRPNYMGCRIAIGSKFNISLWQDRLKDYEDQHVVNLIQYGFPLGIKNKQILCRKKVTNHASAKQFPREVSDFIKTELDHGTLLGPFSKPPLPEYHCSPIMTRPKDVTKRRVIVDLSYGDVSVNGATHMKAFLSSCSFPHLIMYYTRFCYLRNPSW